VSVSMLPAFRSGRGGWFIFGLIGAVNRHEAFEIIVPGKGITLGPRLETSPEGTSWAVFQNLRLGRCWLMGSPGRCTAPDTTATRRDSASARTVSSSDGSISS